ncbi:MAG: hypothetical protein JSU83_07665 [Deltaproteobacteria bacterium]|nr:MAG: hypothetical protein JSU83_07665 [Deltaproteobacteria bacterium]
MTMKKNALAILVGLTILSAICSPLYGADFAPIFPKQAAQIVSQPNFTWATGDFDLFVLCLVLPFFDDHYYIPVLRYKEPYFLIPEFLWDYLTLDGGSAWLVIGLNTVTSDWAITPWQFFQKVSDCVVEFPDPNLEAAIREAIGEPEGDIMASELQILIDLSLFDKNISDITRMIGLLSKNVWATDCEGLIPRLDLRLR